jgi:hypothetical protein
MATQRQIRANRRNAALSTGPKTPQGKAISAANAITHGFCARNAVLPSESSEDYQALLDQFENEFQPPTARRIRPGRQHPPRPPATTSPRRAKTQKRDKTDPIPISKKHPKPPQKTDLGRNEKGTRSCEKIGDWHKRPTIKLVKSIEAISAPCLSPDFFTASPQPF